VLSNLINALGGYTEQQLNKMNADQRLNSVYVNNLVTAAGLADIASQSYQAELNRKANDEEARSNNETSLRQTKNDAESAQSIARNEAAVKADADSANTLTNLLGNNGTDISGVVSALQGDGTKYIDSAGTVVRPQYDKANYVNETTRDIIAEGVKNVLTSESFNRLTQDVNAKQLADDYGVGYLKNIDDTVDKYTEFANQANAESDRVFNQAQRAYLASIAAGDAKTAEQLVRLAQTAGTSQRNLINASALSNQFAQQRANSNVGDTLLQDQKIQQANNQGTITDAQQKGRDAWKNWLGSGLDNENTLYSAQQTGQTNASAASGAYSSLAGTGMNAQKNQNDIISQLNNVSNKNYTALANTYTGNNAAGASSNIYGSQTANATKNALAAQKKLLQNIVDKGI
jgi:hypothetical protein